MYKRSQCRRYVLPRSTGAIGIKKVHDIKSEAG